jgi:site-specific DNA-cytosine methylase
MVDRGWQVVRVDLEERFRPDVVGDVRSLSFREGSFDLVWGSPPCTEFSRAFMPWHEDLDPDMGLVEGVKRIVGEVKPRWWVIENVKGAQNYLGKAQFVSNPVYLWGSFPPLEVSLNGWKERLSSTRREERAKLPYKLSLAVARSCESALF